MTDMNGHESNNQQSHYTANAGIPLMPLDAPPPKKLTGQPVTILSHLQSKGSITPWIARYQYACMNLGASISTLRKAGWKIKTDRRKDRNGQPFPSYRLLESQAEAIQQEEYAPLFINHLKEDNPDTDISPTAEEPAEEAVELTAEEPTEVLSAPLGDQAETFGRVDLGGTMIGTIKSHLLQEGSISPQASWSLYRIQRDSLRSIVRDLRRNGLAISSVLDSNGKNIKSYQLITEAEGEANDDTETQKELIDPTEGTEMPPVMSRYDQANIEAKMIEMDRQRSAAHDSVKKVRFIVPISASESSVTLTRADFDFMMQIVNS